MEVWNQATCAFLEVQLGCQNLQLLAQGAGHGEHGGLHLLHHSHRANWKQHKLALAKALVGQDAIEVLGHQQRICVQLHFPANTAGLSVGGKFANLV